MGDVGERPVGAANDAVHFPDVGAVIGSDHDSVQGRRGTIEMHEQATFVAFGFNGASEHLKTCSILRPSAFGVVGITRGFVDEAT